MKRIHHLLNQRFERLLVIGERKGKYRHEWISKCDCGNTIYCNTHDLIKGKTKSCGCYNRANIKKIRKNLTNCRFGELTVLNRSEDKGYCFVMYKCLCSCGGSTITSYSNLITGKINRCGNCQDRINGVVVSKQQRQIKDIIGRGILNFKTVNSHYIDIAFVLNGQKIAVEYDEWFWHGYKLQKDAQRIRSLLNSGWKVLHIRANRNLPTQEQLCNALKKLESIPYTDIELPHWGVGPTIKEV